MNGVMRTGWIWMYSMMVGIACVSGNALAEFTTPKKVVFESNDKMIQFMPETVTDVTAGPDGRLWLKLKFDWRHKISVAEIKKQIDAEFGKTMPQLYGGKPVLFESNGRVWFAFNNRSVLLGYDGKTWIVETPGEGCGIWGQTPTSRSRIQNFEFNETPFIIGRRGIHWYKEGKMRYQEFIKERKDRIGSAHYAVSKSANRLLVSIRSGGGFQHYEFKNDRWEAMAVPKDMVRILYVLPIGKDNLFLGSVISVFKKSKEKPDTTALDALIAQLGADGFKARREATDALKGQYADVLPYLSKALKQCDDPEQKARLKDVIDDIKKRSAGGSMVVLGKYALKSPKLRFTNRLDESYVFSTDEIHHGKVVHKHAVLLLEQNGTEHLITDQKTVERLKNYSGDSPICSGNPRGLWFGERLNKGGLRFLDLEEKKLTHKVPVYPFFIPYALTKDGGLICNRYGYSDETPLLIYRPWKTNDRTLIKPMASAIAGEREDRTVTVDGDGRLWLRSDDGDVSEFDGKTKSFKTLKELKGYRHIHEAGNDTMLDYRKAIPLFGIVDGKTVNGTELPIDFILKHKASLSTSPFCHVAFTNDGLWEKYKSDISCMRNGAWVDLSTKVKQPNGRNFRARFMASTQRGKKLFVTNERSRHNGGCSFLLSWKDGALLKEKMPHCTDDEYLEFRVYDQGGGYWYPASIGQGLGTCDRITGQLAVQVKPDGTVVTHKNVGVPFHADRSNCIWLGKIWGEPKYGLNVFKNSVNVFRDGTIVTRLDLAGTKFDDLRAVSPTKGTVVIFDGFGFRLFTHPKGKPGEYKLKRQFFVDLPGRVERMITTKDGHVVLTVPRRNDKTYVTILDKADLE